MLVLHGLRLQRAKRVGNDGLKRGRGRRASDVELLWVHAHLAQTREQTAELDHGRDTLEDLHVCPANLPDKLEL